MALPPFTWAWPVKEYSLWPTRRETLSESDSRHENVSRRQRVSRAVVSYLGRVGAVVPDPQSVGVSGFARAKCEMSSFALGVSRAVMF